MREIQLVGGCFNGKICKITDEIFSRGYLEIYEPLLEDFDHMSGCFDLKVVEYRISFPDTGKWVVNNGNPHPKESDWYYNKRILELGVKC